MALTKEQMWEAATERYIHIHKLYLDNNVSADSMFEELCCSVYGGDEWNEAGPEKPVRISDTEFKYRGIVFRITQDKLDDKSYIWCSKYKESDDLVWWVWGCVLADREWLINTDVLDEFIDSHEEKQNG